MSTALPIESPAGRPHRVAVGAVLRSFSPRVVLAVVALALVGFAIGYLGSWPPVATVMSGSMAPTINTGDVVVLKRLDGLPRKGDIVEVSVPAQARSRYGYPPVVVHRVVRVTADGTVTTKGDARPRNDPFTVRRSELNAKVVAHIPAAGRVLAFLMSPMGLLWIAGGAVMLFFLPFLDRRQEVEQAEHDTLAAMRDELHAMSEALMQLRAEPLVLHQTEPAPPRLEPPPELEPQPLPELELELEAPPAEPEPSEPAALPVVDWTDLETEPDPQPAVAEDDAWLDPPEFVPAWEPVGSGRVPRPRAADTWLDPEPRPAAITPAAPTYVGRRRLGGLLNRLG